MHTVRQGVRSRLNQKADEAVAALERYFFQEHVGEHARIQADVRLVQMREQS